MLVFFSKNAQKFSDLEFNGTNLDKRFLVHEPFCEKWVNSKPFSQVINPFQFDQAFSVHGDN